jgi:putative toxin-antitoxin system antitoxin component (TIGR02293 family)
MKTISGKKLNLKQLDLGWGESQKVFYFLFDNKAESWCKWEQAISVIDCIRLGLPKQGVNTFLEKTSVTRNQLSHILHISSRQLDRYAPDERLPPEQSNFLFELTRVYTKAIDVLGDVTTAEHWLSRKNVALGNYAPLEILDTTEGLRLVDNLLMQIEFGFYS